VHKINSTIVTFFTSTRLTCPTLLKRKFSRSAFKHANDVIWAALVTIALCSCSTLTPSPPSVPQPISTRQASLNRIQNWQLYGKIAVQTDRDAGSASFNWTQHHDNYVVSLSGPLGTHPIKLSGRMGYTVLETSNGKRFTAQSPEILLAQQWGFNLPVSNLKYWIRGLPAPNLPAKKHTDAYGRLSQLSQAGSTVQYLSYHSVHSVDLPDKIFITSPSLKTKIIIYSWQIG
jgi:outer membrane lipoprotein LolB